MKIGLIYHQFISRGGLEKYLYSFANQLLTRSVDVEILTRQTDEVTRQFPAPVRVLPAPPLPSSLQLQHFAKAAAAAVQGGDYDVTIGFGRTTTHDLHRAGGGCHRVYSRLLNPVKRLGLKNRIELDLERRLYTGNGTRLFVVNSRLVGDQLRAEYGVSEDRIEVIHTAVDTEHFRPERDKEIRDRLRARLAGDAISEKTVFLFVSRSHRRKGLDVLLDAWPGMPSDCELWIVGAPLKSTHQRAIRSRGLTDRVRTLGASDDVRPFYQAADFFVHPTLYDACANTVLQSMACGLPGLISNRDGAIEFVDDGGTGLVLAAPEETEAVLAVLQRAAGHSPEDRRAMGSAARSRVEPLTWESHVDQWLALIDERLHSDCSRSAC